MYATAQPFPHIRLEDFLTAKHFQTIEEALSEQTFEHKESDLFSLAQTPDLGEEFAEFKKALTSKEAKKWIKEVTGVEIVGETDMFGAIYQDTDYLICHDDQLEDRKIAWILNITTLPKKQGGGLSLYTDNNGPEKKVATYQPTKNSLTLFTVSNTSWHEVEEVTAETHRVTLGGWLK